MAVQGSAPRSAAVLALDSPLRSKAGQTLAGDIQTTVTHVHDFTSGIHRSCT